MQVLFVHGMGRSPLSGWPLLQELKSAGFDAKTFSYFVSVESFDTIKNRLMEKILEISKKGNYILVGHSLGGVLIRAAINSLNESIKKPEHVFLLGSPIKASKLAKKFRKNSVFRSFTRDCGNLLASDERMALIGKLTCPATNIIGIKGISWQRSPFQGEENDGIVSLSEVRAEWLLDEIRVPIIHTLLPSSPQVAKLIMERIHS